MSNITVNVTNPGAANVSVSGGSTVNATVGNGGTVAVGIGSISPGNATVVSGTLTINSTTTLSAGSAAYAKNVGTAYSALLDIGLPAGPATNVTIGNTTTLSAGSNATVAGTASGSNLTLAFGIPAGAAGQNGTNGVNGTNGITPSFAIGNVSTVAAGGSASVTAATSNNGANVTLNFAIPRGADGTGGSNVTLSDSTPSNLGTASAGSSTVASRSDHVHALPVIAYQNLSGVPSNFPTNTTLVSGLSAGYSAANHGHNYVTALNNLTGALTLAAGGNVSISSANSTLTISASAGLDENGTVDGGSYVGEILGGITFTTHPQSQTITVNGTLVSFGNITPNVDIYSTVSAGVSSYGNRLYASTTAAGDVWFSENSGTTWSQLALVTGYSGTSGVPMAFASNGTRTLFTTGLGNVDARYSDNANLSASAQVTGLRALAVAYLPAVGRFTASGTFVDDGNVYGGVIMSSTDAVNWTIRVNDGTPTRYKRMFVVSGRCVAMQNEYGDGGSSVSADGVSWSSVSVGYAPSGAAANALRIVAVNGSTSTRYTSDGLTWTAGTLPVACDRIDYAAGLFWATRSATTSTDICTSPDGIAWTLRDAGASRRYFSVASASGSSLALVLSDYAPRQATLTTGTTSANLTAIATASGGQNVSYQWQSSADAGTTWASINGATSTALNLTGLTTADSGRRYRSQASATGAATQSSQSATLTVTE
jgi:hypothetical protein